MRANKCGLSQEERQFRRLNYCGTCKTMGSVFSAKARLLLNHDVVFLAELLSALSGEILAGWSRPYQSFNCLSLPKDSAPSSLRWAAAANVILAEFKIEDHLDDGEGRGYKLARRAFSKDFQKAETLLVEWGFPLDEIKSLLRSQRYREAAAGELDDVAFPTAQTTAIFFREGVRHVGRPDLSDLAFDLGFGFGKLVYLIDAFEDFEKDHRRGKFNAFAAVHGLAEVSIPKAARMKIVNSMLVLGSEIAAKIGELPIETAQRELFASRLLQNLNRKLATQLPVVHSRTSCGVKPTMTFRERFRASTTKARSLSNGYSWQMPLVFVFVLVFALVAPAAQAREVRSARECFDLGFNLMFLGAVFGSVLALPKTLLMVSPPEIGGVTEEAKKAIKKDGSGGCCGCDADCCDGCDCCCDLGSCCECGDCC